MRSYRSLKFVALFFCSQHISEDQYNGWLVFDCLTLASRFNVHDRAWRTTPPSSLRSGVVSLRSGLFRVGSVIAHAAVSLPAFQRVERQPVSPGSRFRCPRTTSSVDHSASETTAVADGRHHRPREPPEYISRCVGTGRVQRDGHARRHCRHGVHDAADSRFASGDHRPIAIGLRSRRRSPICHSVFHARFQRIS